jgi:hypothetical protein
MGAYAQYRNIRMTACSIVVLFSLYLSVAVEASAQQNSRSIDMRNQLAPIAEEQAEAAKGVVLAIVSDNPNAQERSLPLQVTLQSVTPVSLANLASLKANLGLVEVSIQNVGDHNVAIPISREMKMLHAAANQDRRIFSCAVKLSLEPSKEEVLFSGLTLYSSSTDSTTVIELRPKETLNIRFEVNFQNALTTNAEQWREHIGDGFILGRVQCSQQYLTLPQNVVAGERRYQGRSSDVLRSNEMRLSILQ